MKRCGTSAGGGARGVAIAGDLPPRVAMGCMVCINCCMMAFVELIWACMLCRCWWLLSFKEAEPMAVLGLAACPGAACLLYTSPSPRD
eukprot:417625-Alexandrium_andersonii.AAC.1